MKELYSHIKNNGYALVEYPLDLREAVIELGSVWKRFSELPEEIKLSLSHNEDEGYELQTIPGPTKDLKEDFHATPDGVRRLLESGEVSSRIVLDFLHANNHVFSLVESHVIKIAEAIGEGSVCKDFLRRVKSAYPRWIIRCIHYFPGQEENSEIASSHRDKSGLTLHLYENTPGFQYFWDAEYHDVSFDGGSTLVIAGMQTQLVTGLPALSHRVVATPESKTQGRYSIVLFVPLDATPWWNKKEFGRLQDFPAGYFYNMSQEKLSKYFQ